MSKTNPDRRDFLKMGSAASVVAATIPAALAVAVEELPNEKGPYDLVIAGGRCVDSETGLDAVRNLGIKGGRIAAISEKKLEGTKKLNAEGQVVAPGFIDLHAHGQQLPAAWVHIVIETSGVADPYEVARTFTDAELQAFAPLDGIVTVVDCELPPSLEGEMLELAKRQVSAADVAVLNKVDLVDADGLKRAHDWVEMLAPNSRSLETSGRAAITVGQPWGDEVPKSRVVFIGSRGGVNSSEISALFLEYLIKHTNSQDRS